MSKLMMVDLAGSEKVSKTKATGIRLEEAKSIGKSLSTLALVIEKLVKKSEFINYRDSVLTRLLSDALGGNSKTSLIVTASPSEFNLDETLSALRFGQNAKKIVNKVIINEELSSDEYKKLWAKAKKKVAYLTKENNKLKTQIETLQQSLKV